MRDVTRVRKHEASSESCGNNLIRRTLNHHARSKRSPVKSTVPTSPALCLGTPVPRQNYYLQPSTQLVFFGHRTQAVITLQLQLKRTI